MNFSSGIKDFYRGEYQWFRDESAQKIYCRWYPVGKLKIGYISSNQFKEMS